MLAPLCSASAARICASGVCSLCSTQLLLCFAFFFFFFSFLSPFCHTLLPASKLEAEMSCFYPPQP